MKRTTFGVAFATLALALAPGATSQPARDLPPTYACTRATGAITIDGALDEGAWAPARFTEDFIDIRGARDRPPAHRTRAKLAWDDEHLYVAADLAEPRVASTIRRRDEQLFREQCFELFLDPGGDGRDYLELQINPLNTVCDLSMDKPYREKGRSNVSFDLAGLRSAVRVNGTLNDASDADEGWTIELAIPWAALKALGRDTVAPPRAGDRWRVNLARMRPADGEGDENGNAGREMSVWSAQGEVNMHLPQRWGWVEFVAARSR